MKYHAPSDSVMADGYVLVVPVNTQLASIRIMFEKTLCVSMPSTYASRTHCVTITVKQQTTHMPSILKCPSI